MGDVLSFPFNLSLCILIRGLNLLVLPAVLPSGFPFERLPRSLILFLHLAKSHRLYDSPDTPEDSDYRGVGAVVRSLPSNRKVLGSIPGSAETGLFGDLLSR